MRVLLTGMSGTGKSTVVAQLRRRGWRALDADDDGFTEPGPDGAWHWRTEAVQAALAVEPESVVFFAGCSDEQASFTWDRIVLLTAGGGPARAAAAADRNSYGRSDAEWERVRRDLSDVEPRLRGVADQVVETRQPLDAVLDAVLTAINRSSGAPPVH